MRDTSREAYARTAPTRTRARAEVLRALAEAGAAGLTDRELFRLLPAWGESTIRPARNRLVADRLVVATAARRYSPSGCACIVWRLAALSDGASDGSGTAAPKPDPCGGPMQSQAAAKANAVCPADEQRTSTREPTPQASEQSEPSGAGGAP